jgi:hypothetical protein
MGGACSTKGGEVGGVQVTHGKAIEKETTRNTREILKCILGR